MLNNYQYLYYKMYDNFLLPVGQGLPARVSGWVTGPHKLHALKLDPCVIGRPVEPAMLKHLSQERNDTLGVWKKNILKSSNTVTPLRHPQLHRTLWLHSLTVFIHVGQIDFITEQNQPLVHLYGRQHHSIWSTFVLTVLIECLQQQFWGGSTGEVQANHLSRRENNHSEHPNHCRK